MQFAVRRGPAVSAVDERLIYGVLRAAVAMSLQRRLWLRLFALDQGNHADTVERCMISALSGCGFPNNSPDDRG